MTEKDRIQIYVVNDLYKDYKDILNKKGVDTHNKLYIYTSIIIVDYYIYCVENSMFEKKEFNKKCYKEIAEAYNLNAKRTTITLTKEAFNVFKDLRRLKIDVNAFVNFALLLFIIKCK